MQSNQIANEVYSFLSEELFQLVRLNKSTFHCTKKNSSSETCKPKTKQPKPSQSLRLTYKNLETINKIGSYQRNMRIVEWVKSSEYKKYHFPSQL
ncbi:hypothetical protein ENUP19_0002G0052 [Entamoeba nuttalli]|uniref:Uncharacterized protein n=1 Tax=Entamoeba nuttalli TaxID=412467 RepID=A0ABQ0D761_9EUKA